VAFPTKAMLGLPAVVVPVTVDRLRGVLDRIASRGVNRSPVIDLLQALALKLGFQRAALNHVGWRIEQEGGSAYLVSDNERILLPEALCEIANSWSRRRQ